MLAYGMGRTTHTHFDVKLYWAQSETRSCPDGNRFLYVSSAGVYKPSVTPPHVEGDPVKASAGHIKVAAGG